MYSSSPLTKRLRNHTEDNLIRPEAHGSCVMGLTRVLPYRQQQRDGDRTTSVTTNPAAATTPSATTILPRALQLPPSHHITNRKHLSPPSSTRPVHLSNCFSVLHRLLTQRTSMGVSGVYIPLPSVPFPLTTKQYDSHAPHPPASPPPPQPPSHPAQNPGTVSVPPGTPGPSPLPVKCLPPLPRGGVRFLHPPPLPHATA